MESFYFNPRVNFLSWKWVNEKRKGEVDKIDEKKNGKRALKEATFGNKRLEIKLNTNTRDYGVSLNIYGCIINLII